MVTECDGDPDSLEMQLYRAQVKESQDKYWEKQKEQKLNKLLQEALKKEGLAASCIKKAKFLPIEYCIRGFHHSTDVIIFSSDDFKDIDLAFDKEVNVDQYANDLHAGVNPQLLKDRPVLSVPSEGKKLTPIKILLKGYWGFFSERNVMYKTEKVSEVWQYKAGVSDLGSGETLHIGFYAKRKDDKVGWVYFPIKTEDKLKLEKLLE